MRIRNLAGVVALGSLILACDRDATAPANSPPDASSAAIAEAASAGTWTVHTPLQKGRSDQKAAALNGVIYVIGGKVYEEIRAGVEAYDVASRTWAVRRALPKAMIPNGATVINGRIYVAGGQTGEVGQIDERYSRALYVYDPGRNVWARKADMPSAALPRAVHQGAIDGKLYVYAGMTFNPDGSIGPHRFFRYNPVSNAWVSLSRPSYARSGGASGVIKGKFYLVGGTLPTSRSGAGHAYDVHIYDPAHGWSKKPLGLFGLDNFGFAYAPLGGKLYIVGTNASGDCMEDVSTIYDPASNEMSAFASPAPLRWHTAGVAVQGQFFVIGGHEVVPDLYDCGIIKGRTRAVLAYTP